MRISGHSFRALSTEDIDWTHTDLHTYRNGEVIVRYRNNVGGDPQELVLESDTAKELTQALTLLYFRRAAKWILVGVVTGIVTFLMGIIDLFRREPYRVNLAVKWGLDPHINVRVPSTVN